MVSMPKSLENRIRGDLGRLRDEIDNIADPKERDRALDAYASLVLLIADVMDEAQNEAPKKSVERR